MTDKQVIKKLRESLYRAGEKIQHQEREIGELQEEIAILTAENIPPMYSEGVDHMAMSYKNLETQFKEFMTKMKSFRFWLKYRIEQYKIKRKKRNGTK